MNTEMKSKDNVLSRIINIPLKFHLLSADKRLFVVCRDHQIKSPGTDVATNRATRKGNRAND